MQPPALSVLLECRLLFVVGAALPAHVFPLLYRLQCDPTAPAPATTSAQRILPQPRLKFAPLQPHVTHPPGLRARSVDAATAGVSLGAPAGSVEAPIHTGLPTTHPGDVGLHGSGVGATATVEPALEASSPPCAATPAGSVQDAATGLVSADVDDLPSQVLGAGSADAATQPAGTEPVDPGAPPQTKLEWIDSGVEKVANAISLGVDTFNAVRAANSPFVGAAAEALLEALSSVAIQVPYIGDCVKVLRDIFDLYKVGSFSVRDACKTVLTHAVCAAVYQTSTRNTLLGVETLEGLPRKKEMGCFRARVLAGAVCKGPQGCCARVRESDPTAGRACRPTDEGAGQLVRASPA
jgi:hypothetical protein